MPFRSRYVHFAALAVLLVASLLTGLHCRTTRRYSRRRSSSCRGRRCRQVVQGCEDYLFPWRPRRRRICQQCLQRRQAGGSRSRSHCELCLLRLGSAEDAAAVQRSGCPTKPDGIAVMGHPGDDPFAADRRRRSQGIIVTSQNTELPTMLCQLSGRGFGYVGAVNYTAGYNLGKEAVKRFALKSGDLRMVWGLLSQPSRGERTKGVIDALEEAGLTVYYWRSTPLPMPTRPRARRPLPATSPRTRTSSWS